MSLILEALRKSEAERQRGRMPHLHAELPPIAPTRTSRTVAWPWMAGGVLLLAGGLAAWSMLRAPDATVPPPGDTTVHASPRIARDALPPVPHLERSAAPVVARTAPAPADTSAPPAPPDQNTPRATTERMPPPSSALAPPASAQSAPLAPPAAPAPLPLPPAPDAGGTVMTLADLAPAQRKALPPLRLSMHMWNDDPSQRFVILDGARVGEGDRVGDAVVRAITHDGVLLDWQGRALKIPLR